MFEARLQTQAIDPIIDIATALDNEAVFQVHDGGLALDIMDPANVAMISATLGEAAFENLSAEELRMGVNLDRFEDVLGMGDGDASFDYDDETRKLVIEVDGLEYTMALIDPDSIRNAQDIPELDFAAEVSIETSELKRGIKAAKMVSDTVELGIEDGEFVLSASGDTDDVDYTAEDASVSAAASDAVEDCNATFSLDYVEDLMKAVSAEEATLWLGDELPVVTEYEFAPVGDDDDPDFAGECRFAIAPRIDSN